MLSGRWTTAVFGLAVVAYASLTGPRTDLPLMVPDVGRWAGELADNPARPADHAHHLLVHTLAWALAHGLAMLDGGLTFTTAWRAYAWLSSIGGAATVAFVFTFAARYCGRGWALLFALLLAACQGVWVDAASGESWPLAVAASLGLLLEASRDDPRTPRLIAWLLLATLLRQDAVLIVVALPFLLAWRQAVVVTAVAGVASLTTYVGGYVWICDSDRSFVMWLIGIADGGAWGSGPPHARAAQLGQSVIYAIAAPDVTMYRADRGPLHSLVPGALILTAATVALVPGERRPVRRALVVYLLTRALFFGWWYPQEFEFMSATLPPLVMLGAASHPGPTIARWRAGLLGLCLVAVVGSSVASSRVLLDERVARQLDHAVTTAGSDRLFLAVDGRTYFALRNQHPRADVVFLLDPAEAHRRIDRARRDRRKAAVVLETGLAGRLECWSPVHEALVNDALRRGRFVDRSGPGGQPYLAIER